MADTIFVILWFICSLAVWVIYHRLFSIWYFDLFNGCLKEIITAGVIGAVLAAIIIRFWFIAIIVTALFFVALFRKS